MITLNLVEASIDDLQQLLSSKSITSVELVAKYLQRISTYDARGPCLNAIPILNQDAFDQAAASDIRRREGRLLGPLDGIPYTIKDSMKYKGMTCACGSPALANLIAIEDSFVVERLRNAGAVCIGRTNTPPMMASGMHRGLYGRAESPYNLDYLTAAFSFGSSNGAATSTAASFAAFGLGSETVSSGRSPASNNGLVAYTPSRGVISPRGVWPLYPTCDVIVPYARTVKDMLTILEVLAVRDSTSRGDFWREQNFVGISDVYRPVSYLDLLSGTEQSIQGKCVAVPKMYIGGRDPKAKPTVVSKDVIELWERVRICLETMGAKVVETEFPLVTNYEDDTETGETNNVAGFQPGWNQKERRELVAYSWDDFLRENCDPRYPSLASIDGSQLFPRPVGYIPDRYMEHKNFMDYPGLVHMARDRNEKSIWDLDGIEQALPALEAQRKRDFEEWMDRGGIDFVVFPANGDIGKADLDINDDSARHALQNGVKYSNGNRAIRHLGVPTVSVCMGLMTTSKMPVNLTFAGRHGQDSDLLRYAYAFEQQTKSRIPPPVTPVLPSDNIRISADAFSSYRGGMPTLLIESFVKVDPHKIRLNGTIGASREDAVKVTALVDGSPVPSEKMHVSNERLSFEVDFEPFEPAKPLYGGVGQVVGNVLIVVLAHSSGGVAGKFIMIDQKAPLNQIISLAEK